MAEAKKSEEEAVTKKSKKMIIIPVAVLALGLVGGVGFFLMGAKSAPAKAAPGASTTTTTIALGPIVRLSSITLNLTDGHVLKVGMALQMVKTPKNKDLAAVIAAAATASSSSTPNDSPLGGLEAKALDAAIRQFGAMTFANLSDPVAKQAACDQLSNKISTIYDGDVTQVYYTDFVMS